MDFAYDTTTTELQERLQAFMEEFIYPAEETFFVQRAEMDDRWASPPIVEELKNAARAQGLWNLFLPRTHEYGAGLTNVQYAPLAEIMGRAVWLAPEATNCAAPDTGNMELLSLFGSAGSSPCWRARSARRSR
jgi:acyl-CoA dehydrogenase